MSDQLFTFNVDGAPIRGRIVKLDQAWQRIRDRNPHSADAQRLLGEMVAVVAMLAQGVKLDGSVILQIRGTGPVTTAMAECSNRRALRAVLRAARAVHGESLAALTGEGHLAITLKPVRGEMHQGIIGLEANSIAGAVEDYFATSEQLPTRIWAATDAGAAAGLMLQRLPDSTRRHDGEPTDEDAWGRVTLLASTVTSAELLSVPAATLLQRLFATETVRLHPPSPLSFGCSCSRGRTSNALRVMGRAEVEDILAREGEITVTCEFCGSTYGYDAIDAHLLFESPTPDSPETRQ